MEYKKYTKTINNINPSILLIYLLIPNTKSKPLTINKKGVSFFIVFFCTGSLDISEETPRTTRILKKFEPTTLATLISFCPDNEDVILTAASGALVPIATMVSPIVIDGILNFLAIEAAPSTNKSAPFIRKKKPIIKRINDIVYPPKI